MTAEHDAGAELRPRRKVLAVAGTLALAGCGAIVDGASYEQDYEQDDHELSFEVACIDGSEKVVTLSWTWKSGGGGRPPPDLATIYWDEDKWEPVDPDHDTTKTVRYLGPGVTGGMRSAIYVHDDADAAGGETYAAGCRLAPTGEYTLNERNVFGEFIHRAGGGTPEGKPTGAPPRVSAAWDTAVESDAEAAPCEEGSQ